MIDISPVLRVVLNCGYVTEKLPLNIKECDCPECGIHPQSWSRSIDPKTASLAYTGAMK
ncbi:MAG: hypothetical protein O4804_02165 [Trichodesmium sp. St11_bin5]|nr:hypothetical protein [Trichodesmium sp. St11_bin5]MDT9341358.1 hypothetical protein [Trichodesmium erythraeum 21-75]